MKKVINGILLLAAIAIFACNQPAKQQDSSAADTATNGKQVVNNENTAEVFTAYINLKNQFLKSNVDSIKITASILENKLNAIKGCSGTGTFAQQIATTNDIKAQRATFLTLSQDIIMLVKGAHLKTTVYVDHCPMADNGKGGDWLSLNQSIENPYFPEHMKECGQVKEKLN